jgi:hypothetical protein
LGVLWILWLATAAETAQTATTFDFGGCTLQICEEAQAVEAFAFLAWLLRESSDI